MRVNLCGEKCCQLLSPCAARCSVSLPLPPALTLSLSLLPLRLWHPGSACSGCSCYRVLYAASFMVCCRYLHFIFACGERKCKLIYYAQATECRAWQEASPAHAPLAGASWAGQPREYTTQKKKKNGERKRRIL